MSNKLTTDEMLTARRELTAKKLADLGWEECVFAGERAVESPDGMRILPGLLEGWIVAGNRTKYADFDEAVDSVHAARFDRTAELNEPITMPDEDRCETSQTDLQTAEIERNWNDVAWLQAELIKARDRIAKQATEAAEKRTAYNAEIDRLTAELQNAQTRAFTDHSVCDRALNDMRFDIAKSNAIANNLLAAAGEPARDAIKDCGIDASYRLAVKLKKAAADSERAATLEREIDRLRKALMEAGSLAERRGEEIVRLNAAANRQHAADKWESQAVRLEWSPWDADKETDLRATFGGFSAYIARITIDSQVTVKLYYTDTTNGETVTITGLDLAKIAPILSTLIEAAGFTMPPIPALSVQE